MCCDSAAVQNSWRLGQKRRHTLVDLIHDSSSAQRLTWLRGRPFPPRSIAVTVARSRIARKNGKVRLSDVEKCIVAQANCTFLYFARTKYAGNGMSLFGRDFAGTSLHVDLYEAIAFWVLTPQGWLTVAGASKHSEAARIACARRPAALRAAIPPTAGRQIWPSRCANAPRAVRNRRRNLFKPAGALKIVDWNDPCIGSSIPKTLISKP